MAVFEIKSFRGGLSDYEDKGIAGSFKFGANLDIRKRIDSLTTTQDLADEGLLDSRSPSLSLSPSSSPSSSESPSESLSPSITPSSSFSPSASVSPSASASPSASVSPSSSVSLSPSSSAGLSTVFEDLIRWFVEATDGYTYGFGNTGHIYRRDADGYWIRVYKDENGSIKGASEKPSSNGKRWLYWATDRTLKRVDITGNADWNAVETVNTNLESADWHTMIQIGGALKIANRNYLALVGYDDSYTNEALDLIPTNFAKTLVERNGRVIIGTVKSADTTRGVNGAIETEIPVAQIGADGELFYANGTDSIAFKRFSGGGIVNPDGVTNQVEQVNFFEWEETALSWIDKQEVGNMALFAVYNADTGKGGLYSLGRKTKDHPFVLNLEHQLDADELGACIDVNGTTLVSYRDGSDFGVMATDADNKAVGIYEGLDLKSPTKRPSNITNWKQVEVFMNPLPTGASIQFWYKANKTGSWVQATSNDGYTTYNVANSKKAVFNVGVNAEIFEPRLVITPSGNNSPEIHRIRVYFN